MDVEAVEVLTSLLALLALGGAAALLVLRLVASRWPPAGGVLLAVDDAALWLAFLVAGSATAGSLYFSEVADYVPCRLCWFQRVAMYPLAVMCLVAALRRDRGVRWYAAPLAIVGGAISIYHYVLEWRPELEGGACDVGPPCAVPWFREFGFVTLAFMALCGFAAILVLLFSPTTDPPMEAHS